MRCCWTSEHSDPASTVGFGLAERLEHVRARGAHRGVVHREVVLEQLLARRPTEAPHALLGLGDGEHLDERTLADTQREAGVPGRDEAEQPDRGTSLRRVPASASSSGNVNPASTNSSSTA